MDSAGNALKVTVTTQGEVSEHAAAPACLTCREQQLE